MSIQFYILLASALLSAACTKKASDYPNLKIVDLKIGQGEPVGSYDTVFVHYVGTFTDGSVFDRTPANGEPRRYSMAANTLLDGWKLGLVGMRPGGRRRLTIPPELAYGKKGKFGRIPPDATLIFQIDLIKKE